VKKIPVDGSPKHGELEKGKVPQKLGTTSGTAGEKENTEGPTRSELKRSQTGNRAGKGTSSKEYRGEKFGGRQDSTERGDVGGSYNWRDRESLIPNGG